MSRGVVYQAIHCWPTNLYCVGGDVKPLPTANDGQNGDTHVCLQTVKAFMCHHCELVGYSLADGKPVKLTLHWSNMIEPSLILWLYIFNRDVNEARETRDSKKFLGIEH